MLKLTLTLIISKSQTCPSSLHGSTASKSIYEPILGWEAQPGFLKEFGQVYLTLPRPPPIVIHIMPPSACTTLKGGPHDLSEAEA